MLEPDRHATPTSDIAVELRGVWKIYRQRQRRPGLRNIVQDFFRPRTRIVEALRGIDLTVRRGEIVAYAGPNGAGKSTTIKLLAGLLEPDRGAITSLGMSPSRQRADYVGRIGVAFGQRTELWWDQPVAATFEWRRVVWRVPRDRFNAVLSDLRPLLGLDDIWETLARELSLGQRMRADLALALLHEPEILLLDEPTIGLDVLAKRSILSFIKRVNRERGVTVIVTSHDMSDLEELAGRIVLIHRGEIAFDGDFQTLRRAHGDRRHVSIETGVTAPPAIEGAWHVSSDGTRHTYRYDGQATRLADLLRACEAVAGISDVETHRAPIDDVLADIYEGWQRAPTGANSPPS
ncbi:MAG: ATP-binding cassette domain-containing protein [Chloroflexota bacterium]|nr:MAG: ATP-binding cassette domain-containing protein [Chloroflexota bacterium]